MNPTFLLVMHNPIFRGAFVAFVTAVGVDIHAWKSWGDVAFNWKIASFRWASAIFFGAAAGAGFSSF